MEASEHQQRTRKSGFGFGEPGLVRNSFAKVVNSSAINYLQGLTKEMYKQGFNAIEGREVDSIDKMLRAPLLDVFKASFGDAMGNSFYWRTFHKNINDNISFPNGI